VSGRVWYVAYGSNMCAARLRCYLAGGTPPGGARTYPGARDPSPPAAQAGVRVPGRVYFALESLVWSGGTAFYDPEARGTTPARAYLLTSGQLADLAAQEMHRLPGPVLDWGPAVRDGRVRLGSGRYETLVHVGRRGGVPMLTFTAPWSLDEVAHTAPSAGYLTMLGLGLAEAHGWSADRSGRYLAGLDGARGAWTAAQVTALLRPLVAGQRQVSASASVSWTSNSRP
jgi:hypothetical protein